MVVLEIWRKARHYLFSFPVILAEVAMFCNKTEMKIKEPHTAYPQKTQAYFARCPAHVLPSTKGSHPHCHLLQMSTETKMRDGQPMNFLSLHSCSVCPLCPVCPVLLRIDVAVLHGTTTLWKFRLDKLKIYKGTLPPEACGWENSAA